MPPGVICKGFSLGYVRIINTPTTIFIIIWDFLMFYQIFCSPQVKRCAIITYKYRIHMLANELPNSAALSSHFFLSQSFSPLRYAPHPPPPPPREHSPPQQKLPPPPTPQSHRPPPRHPHPSTRRRHQPTPMAINTQHYQTSPQIRY